MSHPDPDNSMEDDMDFDSRYDYASYDDGYYDDHDDFYGDISADDLENGWDEVYDDTMDGDHDSAMGSIGWGVDEQYESNYDCDNDW